MPDKPLYLAHAGWLSTRRFRKRVAVLVLAAGCAWLPLTTGAASAHQAQFDLRIVNQRLSPAIDSPPDKPPIGKVIRVKRGDQVTLNWTTDRQTQIHLHGYDIEQTLMPGSVTPLSFEAFATGRFPVSVHQTGERRGGHHGAALLYLEVLPR